MSRWPSLVRIPHLSSGIFGWSPMVTTSPSHYAISTGSGTSSSVSGDNRGSSLTPVSRIVWSRLENTAILGFWFFVCLIPLSLGLGVLAGMKEGSWLDRAVSAICILTTSIPPFASTVLISAVFVFSLHWLPGTSTMLDGFLLSATGHAGAGAGAV